MREDGKKYNVEWHQANKERLREVRNKWQRENRDKVNAAVKRWRDSHLEERRSKERAKRESNPEKAKASNQKYRFNRSKDQIEAARESMRKFRQKNEASGMCLNCGNNPAIEGRVYCIKCKEYSKENKRKSRLKFTANGLCSICGKVPFMQYPSGTNEFRPCETCYLKQLANVHLGSTRHWQTLKDKFESQGRLCPYTGIPLTLGLNTALDHILPKSRFPELQNDPTNVQFLKREVNIIKWKFTPDEFLKMCSLVHNFNNRKQFTDDTTA